MSIWIDLTDLLQWKGNLTGIQRVQFNIAKLYIESGKDVKFFVHNEYTKKFTQVDFEPTKIVKSGMVDYGVKDKLPKDHPNRIFRFVGKARRRSIAYYQIAQRYLHRRSAGPFKSDDTILVIGSIWIGNFIEDLVSLKARKKFKLVHFSFDMIPSILPGFVVPWLPKVFIKYHKQVLHAAEGIIAISQSTASDIKTFAGTHGIKTIPKVGVVRIGESIDDVKEKKIKNLEPGFLLSVSTIEARKNHAALFYMLREAREQGITLPKIVIVGRKGWHTEDFRYMVKRDPIAREGIVLLSDTNDAQLTWLYNNCRFTIFPSFYEGWGMPIAESLAYGKMCIASNTSSMPEIAGDLIDYFSPYNTDELLKKVTKYLNQKELTTKEKQIKKQYKPTSWESMFAQVDEFILDVTS